MSNQGQPANIESARLQVLALLDDLRSRGHEFGLPEPDALYNEHHSKLSENVFNVLIIGEVNHGKSSFANAMIGTKILPEDNGEVTCVFLQIVNSKNEVIRARYSDQSERILTREELAQIGSQQGRERTASGGFAGNDQSVMWIELEVPFHFLPSNIRLFDTPGIGSTYAEHGQITEGLVPIADAVIYVLDATDKPISDLDMQFLERIVRRTRHVFFVMTKIDLKNQSEWKALKETNEKRIREQFGERLEDCRVWPVSNRLLREAATSNDSEDLQDSHFPELKGALQDFLFRAAGWQRAADAILVADNYHTTGQRILEDRLATLLETSEAKRRQYERLAGDHTKSFERDWLQPANKKAELFRELNRLYTLGRETMQQTLLVGGSLDLQLCKTIDNFAAADEIVLNAEAILRSVASRAQAAWREVRINTEDHCVKLLRPLHEDTQPLTLVTILNDSSLTPWSGSINIHHGFWDTLKRARMGAITVSWLIGMGASIFGWLGVLAVPGTAAAVVAEWKEARFQQLEQARNKLKSDVRNELGRIRQFYTAVNHLTLRDSLINEYFVSLRQAMDERINTAIAHKRVETTKTEERLKSEAQLNAQERIEKQTVYEEQQTVWGQMRDRLNDVAALFEAANPIPIPPPSDPAAQ